MVKNLPANAGDVGSMPGLGRSLEEGNGNPLPYSCLEEPGKLQSMGLQRAGQLSWTEQLSIQARRWKFSTNELSSMVAIDSNAY